MASAMRPRTVRLWRVLHSWTSLVSMLSMLVLCATGLPLIFHDQLDHALGYRVRPAIAPGGARLAAGVGREAPAANVDSILADARRRHPRDVVQFLVSEAAEPGVWYVRMGPTPNGAVTVYDAYDARTGARLAAYPLGRGFVETMLRVHVDLFAGVHGMILVGVMSLVAIVAIVSGVVLYAPFAGVRAYATVRPSRSSRVRWLDVHNALGVTVAVWLLLVTATGVVDLAGGWLFARWQATNLAAALPAASSTRAGQGTSSVAGVGPILDEARADRPRARLAYLAFPGTAYAGPAQFVAYMHGMTSATFAVTTPVVIDAATARRVGVARVPSYLAMLLVSQPLHFGDFAGLPLQLLWATLDVIAIIVLATGVVLWLRRRPWGSTETPPA